MGRKDIEKRIRQWEAEGYDVSELKAKWFSTRRGNGLKRLLIALVVVAIGVAVAGMIGIDQTPKASFYARPTDGAAPLAVQFYDQSRGVVTGRAWDFGDGSTSRVKNPSHTYTREGTYTVRLTVTGLIGSDTRSLINHIVASGQTSYNLRISSTAGGSVTTPGEGTSSYPAGTVVDLVAEAAEDYEFANWTGDVGTIGNVNAASTTITMNGNYSVTANFEEIRPVRYNLTTSSTAGGTVATPGERTFSYPAGTVVDLVAIDAAGYRFANWTGNVGTIANVNTASTTITMNGNYTVTANFIRQYTLTMAVSPAGSGTTVPAVGSHAYDAGTSVTLTASPASGYGFSYWSGDATGTSPTTTVTMDRDRHLTASFIREPFQCVTEGMKSCFASIVLIRDLQAGDTVEGSVSTTKTIGMLDSRWGYVITGPGGKPVDQWEGNVPAIRYVEFAFVADRAGEYRVEGYTRDCADYWTFTVCVWPPNWR